MDSESSLLGGQTFSTVGRTLKSQAIILGGFVVLIWLLELVDMVNGLCSGFNHDEQVHVFGTDIPFLLEHHFLNPFDQPGVEAYKREMFTRLRKPK